MTSGNIEIVYRAQVNQIQPKGLKQLGILKETILQGFLIKINSLILWCGRAPLKTPLKGRIAVSFYFTCRV
jgi:hypothetical protein